VTAHLTLDLPETMVPTLDGSVTVESPEQSADTSTPTPDTPGLRQTAVKLRRWNWALEP